MDWNTVNGEEREKTKFYTKIGCFFGIVIIGLLIIALIIWISYRVFVPREIQLLVSDSPNNKNKIEIVRVEDFPNPTLRINYDKNSIIKTNLPDDISIEWKNDYEANVTLVRQGQEPDVVKVEFQ
ncbi:hypothetical protein CWR48_16295 [Oceanobacillus arenosus]|uniref:Uncharacterized protein n=1 Tax=Oceanobacillus arenosus TaxID=1229153 RepID=A0A3D8PMX9_9BACI|nr:hypothetical protein [Oceanobacillus arenosus]RDW16598.1 hypothetical protein CWR48_16295 [Oceanobacillus arenosus]